ncbi:MAG: polymer-forming cytoskeletal protein [Bacteroidia bacterium]|nr:polymer-forming cytoskeletal protein [Bacteroidia bacterium]
MSKSHTTDSGTVNIIGAGTIIEGEINTNGDIRVDGSLTGKLNVKGRLVLGASGNIEGEISCQNADISGTINGKINVTDLLALKSSSKLSGDIVANKLAIEPGAVFTGSCSMGGIIKDMKSAETTEEKAVSY